jgi:hypothetical protein
MMKNILLLTAFTALLFSCKKDDITVIKTEAANSKVLGGWDLVSLNVYATGSLIVIDGTNTIQSDTLFNYNLNIDDGAIQIDSEQVTKILRYSVNTTGKVFNYYNGQLQDSLLTPYTFASQPITSNFFYKMTTPDTMAIIGGAMNTGDTTHQIAPRKDVISWSGDTLLITSQSNYDKVTNKGGLDSTYMMYTKHIATYIKTK